jgi:hypothetical protein
VLRVSLTCFFESYFVFFLFFPAHISRRCALKTTHKKTKNTRAAAAAMAVGL